VQLKQDLQDKLEAHHLLSLITHVDPQHHVIPPMGFFESQLTEERIIHLIKDHFPENWVDQMIRDRQPIRQAS
jgi:hypothetical protein